MWDLKGWLPVAQPSFYLCIDHFAAWDSWSFRRLDLLGLTCWQSISNTGRNVDVHTHTDTQTRTRMRRHWLRPVLIKRPFSCLSSCCPLLCPAETKRWGRRNGQPLIKFPPLFLSVPPMLFSYRFWALALCDSQENKQAFRLGTRILLFKCVFSCLCLNSTCLDESGQKSGLKMVGDNQTCLFSVGKKKIQY